MADSGWGSSNDAGGWGDSNNNDNDDKGNRFKRYSRISKSTLHLQFYKLIF